MREEGKCDLSMFGSIAIKLLKKFSMGQVYEIIIILCKYYYIKHNYCNKYLLTTIF